MTCLHCGLEFEVIHAVVNPARRPRVGSVIVCEHCLGCHVLEADALRTFTDEEKRTIMPVHLDRAARWRLEH